MEEEVRLKNALLKKALGYAAKEVVEEYLPDESGKPVLAKRKVTKKENPPDISALKLLLEKADETKDYSAMSDEELLREKHRLLQALKEKENEDEDGRM